MLFRAATTQTKIEVSVEEFLKILTEERIKACTDVAFLAEVLIEKLKEITAPTFDNLRRQKKMSLNPYRAPEIDAMVANIDQRMQSAIAKFNNSINALNEIKKNKFITAEQTEALHLYKKEFSGRTACLFDHILSLTPQKEVLKVGLGKI